MSPGPPDEEVLERAAAGIGGARRVVVLTGAGVSAESGVPTFRGPDGLWKSHRPEELATPGAFARDPRLVWEWYQWRRDLVGGCAPNPGHRAIARLQAGRPDTVLVTQNVDGLHAMAARETGAEGARILELHGSLFRVRCARCPWRAGRREAVDATSEASLPRCPECGALVRPDVVWFGEGLDREVLEGAFHAGREADVCVVVGTSAVVQPAASIPLATLEGGGVLIEVNPERTPLSPLAMATIRAGAGEVLPCLLRA